MPRSKRPPKCAYCRGSHLSDFIFEQVLLLYIQGTPAQKTERLIRDWLKQLPQFVTKEPGLVPVAKLVIGEKSPSEKTIRRHYKRIGLAIFERGLEPRQLKDEFFILLKRDRPKHYEMVLDLFYGEVHDALISNEKRVRLRDASSQKEVTYGAADDVFRRFSRMKCGIRDSVKEHLALAMLYNSFRLEGMKKIGKPVPHVDIVLGIWAFLKAKFRENPC